jgi:hypothetical protein
VPGSNSSGHFEATATVGTASSWGGTAAELRRRGRRKWLFASVGLAVLAVAGFFGVRALSGTAPAPSASSPAAAPSLRDARLTATALPAASPEPARAPAPAPVPEATRPRDDAVAQPLDSAKAPAPPSRPSDPAQTARVKSPPPAAKTPPKAGGSRGKDLFNDLD